MDATQKATVIGTVTDLAAFGTEEAAEFHITAILEAALDGAFPEAAIVEAEAWMQAQCR